MPNRRLQMLVLVMLQLCFRGNHLKNVDSPVQPLAIMSDLSRRVQEAQLAREA